MTDYTVNFYNQTDSTWTLAIYLTVPGIGLDSVCWKRIPAAPGGQGLVTWDPQKLSAVIGGRPSSDTLVYTTLQAKSAEPGSKWKIVNPSGAQELEADGNANLPNQIQILNDSLQEASPGLGMAEVGAIYRPDLLSGLNQTFDAQPNYWAMAFDSVQEGQLITTSSALGAMSIMTNSTELDFSQGSNAGVTIQVDGSTVKVTVSYL